MVPFNTEGLYELRFLMFIESAPQSNKYSQILFTQEQYKKLSEAIMEMYPIKGYEGDNPIFDIIGSDETHPLPDLKTFYTQEEIDS
jgi:hypothetical protein